MKNETIAGIELGVPVTGAAPTKFATLISAVAAGDMATIENQLADDVEWDMMPTGEIVRGKADVMRWLKVGSTDQKRPVVITDLASGDWGIFEYWNIGTVSKELVAFGNQKKWPWPVDPNGLVGQEYKVGQCFVWGLNAKGKIHIIRQYLDTGSIWSQFK